MNGRERTIADKYSNHGWTVIRKGMPDFLMVKGDRVRWVEVKSPSDKLTRHQEEVKRILTRRLGMEYRIARVRFDPSIPRGNITSIKREIGWLYSTLYQSFSKLKNSILSIYDEFGVKDPLFSYIIKIKNNYSLPPTFYLYRKNQGRSLSCGISWYAIPKPYMTYNEAARNKLNDEVRWTCVLYPIWKILKNFESVDFRSIVKKYNNMFEHHKELPEYFNMSYGIFPDKFHLFDMNYWWFEAYMTGYEDY